MRSNLQTVAALPLYKGEYFGSVGIEPNTEMGYTVEECETRARNAAIEHLYLTIIRERMWRGYSMSIERYAGYCNSKYPHVVIDTITMDDVVKAIKGGYRSKLLDTPRSKRQAEERLRKLHIID